jgi:hypothetical protein
VVTGTGTAFTSAMVGGILTYTSGASAGVATGIVGFTSATVITVASSQTVATGTSFSISFGQTRFEPLVNPSATIATERNFRNSLITDNVSVVMYRDSTITPDSPAFYTVTYSGTTATIANSALPVYPDVPMRTATVVGGVAVVGANAIQFIGVYNGVNGTLRATLGTVASPPSSGPPVLGATIAIDTTFSSSQGQNFILFRMESNRVLFFYRDADTAGAAMVLNVSGGAIVAGPKSIWYPGTPNVGPYSIEQVSLTEYILFFIDVPDGSTGRSMFFTVSGNSFSFQHFQTFSIYNSTPLSTVRDDSNQIYILFVDAYDATAQLVFVPSLNATTYNLNYTKSAGLRSIGIAANSGNEGDLIQVIVAGVSDVQSGLTPDSDYFNHGDGRILQVGDGYSRTYIATRVGSSVSPTELVMRLNS